MFTACVGGWALDAMNVQIYSFVIPALIAVWGLTRGQAGVLGTAALLVSAAGGWFAGWFADRFGRDADAADCDSLVLRFLTFLLRPRAELCTVIRGPRPGLGFGFGGEWAAGARAAGVEVIRRQQLIAARRWGSCRPDGQWGGAPRPCSTLSSFPYSPRRSRGARCSCVGLAPALLVFYVRRYVDEPQVYLESKAKIAATGERPSLLEIFRPPLLKVTLIGGLLATGAQGGYFAVTTWLPTFLRTERKLSVLDSAGYLAVLIAGSFVGYLAGGFLADRIGRRMGFLVFALGAGAIVVTYTMIPFGNSVMLVLGFPLGFFSSGVFSGMGAFFTENFPPACAWQSRAGIYVQRGPSGPALCSPRWWVFSPRGCRWEKRSGLFAGIAYAVMAVAAFLLPENERQGSRRVRAVVLLSDRGR